MIGVVGGIGPYAGLDLVKKIFDLTEARCDQEHLPVLLHSIPHKIPDRSEFLLGRLKDNPAIPLAEIICSLYDQGATVVGMPCNTAHSTPIFNEIQQRIPKGVTLINMIHEVVDYVKTNYANNRSIGVLSTTGTFRTNIYTQAFYKNGIDCIQVTEEIQNQYIHPSIYDKSFGIKSHSAPVTRKAIQNLMIGADYLINQGVQAIVLGCTELPIAFQSDEIKGIPLVDANEVLATALIHGF